MLYRRLGIIIVLTHVEVWGVGEDRVEVVEKDSNATLVHFKEYLSTFRGEHPLVPLDNLQLLTGVAFEGNTVGKGTVGGMCGPSSVGVSMDGDKRSVKGVAETVAHEMGHNFGLNHVDEVDGCDCEEGNCVMLSSGIGTTWDECSRKNVSELLPTLAMECLRNRPATLPLGSCGDGVVDEGEECDCGAHRSSCPHSCCDLTSCKLTPNATCGSGPCCDLETCQPFGLTSPPKECRPAHSTCDIGEFCDGSSAECPPDTWHYDGTACEVGRGFCYQGECGSAWGRCKLVWGPDATPCPSKQQEQYNVVGDETGNCGYAGSGKEELKACQKEDAECGTLFCQTPEKSDALGWFFHRTAWVSPDVCRAVVARSTYDQSAWLVPNGAACGDGKMCIDQRCVSRPVRLSTIIFWLAVVILAVLTLLCWDHIRYCWERKGGRTCCHTHLYYCAACLDACCCPCMNRLNRLVLSVLPPMRFPKADCFKLPSRAPGKAEGDDAANGDVVCNGAAAGGPGGGTGQGTAEQEAKNKGPTGDDWGMKDFVSSPPKGVTLKPISHPPAARPPAQVSHVEVPLLNPLQESPNHPRTPGNKGIGQFVNGYESETGSEGFHVEVHPHAHTRTQGSDTHMVPVRPAPPPPDAHRDMHMDAHTDAHTQRPPPSVPPRPVLAYPLRPPLPPPKPSSPLPPPPLPLASFPPPPTSSSSSSIPPS